jgi:hypothetical protein
VYAPSPTEGAFHQGEILSHVVQLCVILTSLDQESEGLEFDEVDHPFAVVLTQECDLDWDFKARTEEPDEGKRRLKLVPNILLCELFPESVIRPKIKGSDIWKRIINNQDERYHQISAVSPGFDCKGEGLPILVADFKHIFTIHTDELYHRLNLDLRRRVLIEMPFVQDLSNRFTNYCDRVALPDTEQRARIVQGGPASPTLAKGSLFGRLAKKLWGPR